MRASPLGRFTLADVQEFADFLSELLAPATQARILAAMKSLFSFGHQVGYLPFDVGRPVKLPSRRDDRAQRILSADDVHSMIAYAKNGRDRALVRTLYIGGLRVAEAVGLRSRDLIARDGGSEAGGQLGVFGKGSKSRPVLVPGSLFAELSTLALPNPDAPLFRSQKKGPDGEPRPITARQAERIVKAAARKAGLKNASLVSPHCGSGTPTPATPWTGAPRSTSCRRPWGTPTSPPPEGTSTPVPTNPRRSTWAREECSSPRQCDSSGRCRLRNVSAACGYIVLQ